MKDLYIIDRIIKQGYLIIPKEYRQDMPYIVDMLKHTSNI